MKKSKIFIVCLSFIVLISTALIYIKPEGSMRLPSASDIQLPLQLKPNVAEQSLLLNQFMQQFSKIVMNGKLDDDFYEKLPEYNQEKPTRPELQQYIQDLNAAIRGKIISFSPMTNTEKQIYIQEINKNTAQYQTMLDKSHFYWLELPVNHQPFQRFPFLLVTNEQKQPTLSRQWLQNSSRLFSHAKLYLEAVQLGNLDSIASFYKNESEADELVNKKAEALVNYYTNLMRFAPQAVKNTTISSLRGDAIELIQEMPNDLNTNEAYSEEKQHWTRRIKIMLNQRGFVKIADIIPAKLMPNSLTLFKDNYQIISLEQSIDSVSLQRIFGNWEKAYFIIAQNRIVVEYPAFKLILQGQYRQDNHYFNGSIVEIELKEDTYHLFDGLRVNKSKTELLESHPFIEESNFIVHYAQRATIHFLLDPSKSKISKIILKSLNLKEEQK